jgi:putative peptidoglycan lipid II flippase
LFISTREQSGEADGWKFLNLAMTMGTWVAIAIGVTCFLLTHLIVRVQAPGFDARTLAMGSQLSYFFFLALPFNCAIAIMRVALNSVGEFAIAGAVKFFDSIFRIAFVATMSSTVGIFSLAFGMLAGTIFQLGLFYFCLRRRGYRFGYTWSVRSPLLRRAVSLGWWPLGGQAAGTVADVVSNNLSSLLGPGKVTALRFATRVIDAVAGVLANSIVTVSMPIVVSAVARRDDERAMEHLRHSMHLLLLVTMPVSIWLAVANRPLIASLYQRMNFTTSDLELVSGILLLMIPYIFLSRLLGLAELPFFGIGNTWIPMLIALAQAGIYIGLAYQLFRPLNMHAFPIARVLSYAVASAYLLKLVCARWGSLNLSRLTAPTIRILIASAVMGVFVLLGQQLVATLPSAGSLGPSIALVFPSALGASATLWVLVLLRVIGVRRAERFPFMEVWLHRQWATAQ